MKNRGLLLITNSHIKKIICCVEELFSPNGSDSQKIYIIKDNKTNRNIIWHRGYSNDATA